MHNPNSTSYWPTDQSASLWEQKIFAFEQAWQSPLPPEISSFAADLPLKPTAPQRFLYELAMIDMEFRWQAAARGQALNDALGGRPRWLDYVAHLQLFGELRLIPSEFISEEYRIRQLWGDRPSHDHFISAFPIQLAELPRWLTKIDDELRADGVSLPVRPAPLPTLPTAADPRAALRWSDFLLQQHIGSGGFGKVYRAIQKSLGRPVAIKALHKARQRNPQAVEQFIREARILARLSHHSIVGVHGLGQFPGGGFFLVLDLIEGEDLQRRLCNGPLDVGEAIRVTLAVAEAIEYAHTQGVIHGDLKPANVLVDERKRVFVTDFGLAQLFTSTDNQHERLQWQGGTLAYLAPEILRGESTGPAVDVFGLGTLLYALLTGQPPHPCAIEGELSREPPAIRRELSKPVEAVLLKCLEADAVRRFLRVADVVAALRESTG